MNINEFHKYYSETKQDTLATENFILNVAKAKKKALYKIMKSNRILDKFPDEIEYIIMSFLKPNFIYGEKEYQGLKV